MSHATIPLGAVRNAVICGQARAAGARAYAGRPMGRFAAWSRYPALNVACDESRHGLRGWPHVAQYFGPMFRGDLERLLVRVRSHCGLPEVHRTWGAGPRALGHEFDDGVMR